MAVLALVACAGQVSGGPVGGVGEPKQILLELAGFKTSAPPEAKTYGQVTLGHDRATTTLVLTRVQMRNGPVTEGPAALRAYDLYTPNLLLVGDPGLVAQVASAPEQAELTLLGYLSGSRHLILVEVRRTS
jgi:hypothetical protein